jgi:magnesium transporter
MNYSVYDLKKVDGKYVCEAKMVGKDELNKRIVDLVDRDLRLFEPAYKISNLIIRDGAFLFKLYRFRAVIWKDSCLFFHPIEKVKINAIVEKMNTMEIEVTKRGGIVNKSLSFENRLVEVILIIIHGDFSNECRGLLYKMDEIFRKAELMGSRRVQVHQEFAKIHHELNRFGFVVKEVMNVMEETMRNEEDMAEMCLTNFNENDDDSRNERVEEMELILENYYRHYEQVDHEIKGAMRELDAAQKQIGIELAYERNVLALFDTQMNVITCGLSFGTFVASIFGMNLRNEWEDSNRMFLGMMGLSVGLVIGMPFIFWKKFERMIKKL